jgi:hypothetical protein
MRKYKKKYVTLFSERRKSNNKRIWQATLYGVAVYAPRTDKIPRPSTGGKKDHGIEL